MRHAKNQISTLYPLLYLCSKLISTRLYLSQINLTVLHEKVIPGHDMMVQITCKHQVKSFLDS